MRPRSIFGALVIVLVVTTTRVFAQAQFSCGGTGSDGALNVPSGPIVTLDVPDNGIFNFTTVNVSGPLRFRRNPRFNPPVTLLATGAVTVTSSGSIGLNGSTGTGVSGGTGGPGGFDGGAPGIAGGQAGAGHGPGAGRAGIGVAAGHATYSVTLAAGHGQPYGSPLLIPLAGGSGGGGGNNNGGGGGGGAILICSPLEIVNNGGTITADAGTSSAGYGSGGAIRLLSPVVRGNGNLQAYSAAGGHGRIRIDTIDRTGLQLSATPTYTVGSFLSVGAGVSPRLDIIRIEQNDIPEGTPSPLSFILPFNSPPGVAITVRASGFSGIVPITIAITPESGNPTLVNAEINADATVPETTVTIDFPQNIAVRVHAWTR